MSTTTGPDLTPARAAVERLMDDTCRITRSGADDGVIDDETGNVVAPGSTPVYEGRCMVKTSTVIGFNVAEVGGVDRTSLDHRVSIPRDAPEVRIGDHVEVLTSRRDPQLPGTKFTITRVRVGTMLVSRRLDAVKDVPVGRIG